MDVWLDFSSVMYLALCDEKARKNSVILLLLPGIIKTINISSMVQRPFHIDHFTEI